MKFPLNKSISCLFLHEHHYITFSLTSISTCYNGGYFSLKAGWRVTSSLPNVEPSSPSASDFSGLTAGRQFGCENDVPPNPMDSSSFSWMARGILQTNPWNHVRWFLTQKKWGIWPLQSPSHRRTPSSANPRLGHGNFQAIAITWRYTV